MQENAIQNGPALQGMALLLTKSSIWQGKSKANEIDTANFCIY
jgi:hypothetical protein